MSESRSKASFYGALRFLLVFFCATTVITSTLFDLFLDAGVRTLQPLEGGYYVTALVIPFLTCVAIGAAAGGVRQGLRVFVPTILVSLLTSIIFSSLPIMLGIIEDVVASTTYLIAVLRANVMAVLLMIFVMIPGVLIGGLMVDEPQPYPLDR